MYRQIAILALLLGLAAPASAQQTITLQPSRVAAIVNGTVTSNQVVLPNCTVLDVLVNFTAGGTATGSMLLFLEDSPDGGTTWDDLAATNAFAFGAAVTRQRFFVNGVIASTATSGSVNSVEALTAGTTRQGPFGDRIRVREVVSGISGSPVGPTYVITAVCKP